MKDYPGKINLSFGAKYVAEDTASRILYAFDHGCLGGKAVPVENLARYLGLDLLCEYLSGDCTELLGVAAFEPQRIYTVDGHIDLKSPAVVIERDIIDRGECGLYRFAVALACSQMLFHSVREGGYDDAQLSFGLDEVCCANNAELKLDEAFDAIYADEESPESFALLLLMPKNGFKRQTVELYAQMGINRATLDEVKHLPAILSELAERYAVPEAAVLVRLRRLNLLRL